ncbi:MAG: hypothetical protein NTV52_21005, partial [Acidobacteria bacterium]|nr:hypothetical protein [Acidobacteriota bacterium]
GEADYPTEVKAKELGINLILGGHRETEVFGVPLTVISMAGPRVARLDTLRGCGQSLLLNKPRA